jgi:hypothetical protein
MNAIALEANLLKNIWGNKISMSNLLELIIYGGLIIAFVAIFLGIAETVKRLEKKMKRIELCLDLVLDKLEIQVPDLLSKQVKELAIDPQKRIAALKLYRTETGAGLKEAKEAINRFITENKRRDR